MKNLFHVTSVDNLDSIEKAGLLPRKPVDMPNEPAGVYLFTDWTTMEDAVMNWLGDRFDEEEELVVLTVSPAGLNLVNSPAKYEVVSYAAIPPENILHFSFV